MNNCSKSIENCCFKHKNLVGFRGLTSHRGPFTCTPAGGSAPDPRYTLALPRSPCVYYFKILKIGPGWD